jgi:hypothetical protein
MTYKQERSMPRPVLNPGAVLWSGENSYVHLRDEEGGRDLTRLSLFRIVYSPVGEGHAAFVISDLEANGLDDDPCAVYTDNRDLARWLSAEVMQNPVWKERQLPVVDARFGFTGDSRHSRFEHIEAAGRVIDVTWSKLDRPYMYEAPAGLVSDKFDLFCLLISAWQVEITVNGRKAAGQTFPMAFQGQNISESCLSLSETWAVPEG